MERSLQSLRLYGEKWQEGISSLCRANCHKVTKMLESKEIHFSLEHERISYRIDGTLICETNKILTNSENFKRNLSRETTRAWARFREKIKGSGHTCFCAENTAQNRGMSTKSLSLLVLLLSPVNLLRNLSLMRKVNDGQGVGERECPPGSSSGDSNSTLQIL